MKNRCWKKSTKGLSATINFLKVLVDGEENFFSKLNHICGGNQHVFYGVRIPKRRLPISSNPIVEQVGGIVEQEHKEANMGVEFVVKFKILFHFIKGKMGQLQMNSWANLFRSLDFDGLNEKSSFDEDVVEYEGKVEDDPHKILLSLGNQIEELKDHMMDLIVEKEMPM
jgi:hypothetical protein